MNYTPVILNRLIDAYEQRGLFCTADSKKHQGIFLSVEKHFRSILIPIMKAHIRKSTRRLSISVNAGFCKEIKISGDNT